MSGPNASESINEKYVFDLAIKPLLAVAKGTSGQIVPVEQARAVDTQFHAIINVFPKQSEWLDDYLAQRGDGLACEYVRLKLLERLKDRPISLRELGEEDHSLVTLLAQATILEKHRGQGVIDELTQFDIQKVTCYSDGERRRFVAHFNATHIFL
jgi:hypothetical protein